MDNLEQMLRDLVEDKLDAKTRAELEQHVAQERGMAERMAWRPSSGPQRDAVHSLADILLYGGAAGGGKTATVVGLAMTRHQRSLVMRRQYSDLGAITAEAIKYNGSRDGFRGTSPPRLLCRDGRLIDFGACAHLGDEEQWQGQDHDFLGIDEAAQFLERQIRFLIGWVRTTVVGQRTRVVLASNPPLEAEGFWLISMFEPWLDPGFPNPAGPGELRWCVTVVRDGAYADHWVDGPQRVTIEGRSYTPHSRTFIPAKLEDNPYLAHDATYRAKMESHIYRAALLEGNFMAARGDAPNQVIPSEWVRDAVRRWTPLPPPRVPMTCLAADVAQGGADETVLARRYDWWFAPLIARAGVDTKDGPAVAGLIIQEMRDACPIVVDMGGGWGGSAVDHLKHNMLSVFGHIGAAGSSARTANDARIGFYNKRAEVWWRFREALDPASHAMGSPIALPDDPRLIADLTSPTWQLKRGVQIQIESKDEIRSRLGRSPDRGDAVVMAWSEGSHAAAVTSFRRGERSGMPQINYGHAAAKRINRRR